MYIVLPKNIISFKNECHNERSLFEKGKKLYAYGNKQLQSKRWFEALHLILSFMIKLKFLRDLLIFFLFSPIQTQHHHNSMIHHIILNVS